MESHSMPSTSFQQSSLRLHWSGSLGTSRRAPDRIQEQFRQRCYDWNPRLRHSLRVSAMADDSTADNGVKRTDVLRAFAGAVIAPLLQLGWMRSADAQVAELPQPGVGQASMRTLRDSELAVSIYPTFSYNALGGGGIATARQTGDVVHLTFDPQTVVIPDVNGSNTTFMGVPMVPPFNIAVHPKKLEGFVDRRTGLAELTFLADFMFTAGLLYKAPPLVVSTLLTTESVQGDVQGGQGRRLDENGCAKLVGIARLEPTRDVLLDKFLRLPSDCKALMSAQFMFNPSMDEA